MSFQSSNSPPVMVLANAISISDNVFASISDDSQLSSSDSIMANRQFKLKYYASFSVTLRYQTKSRLTDPKKTYLCHSFDKGSFWVLQDCMADSIPLHVFSTQGGVIVVFIHDDLNRQSYNKVKISDINKIFSKPGSATDTLQFVENGEPFFLQDTAIKRVGKYFYTASKGLRWIVEAKIVQNSKSVHDLFPTDFIEITDIVNKTKDEVITLTDEASNVTSRNVAASRMTILQDPSGPQLQQHQTPPQQQQQQQQQKPLKTLPTTMLKTDRYTALTETQIRCITFCQTCSYHFEYVTEIVMHFELRPACIRAIKERYPEESSFYTILSKHFSLPGFVNIPANSFFCAECQQTFTSPILYCLHRDQHKSETGFACGLCTEIFVAPYLFYRHDCIRHQKLNNATGHSVPQVRLPGSNSSVYYASLGQDEVDKLLTCPFCRKNCRFSTGFILHFRSSIRCYENLKGKRMDTFSEERMGIPSRPVDCELCLQNCPSQWSYLLHKDHHQVTGASFEFGCKKCQIVHHSPCSFYRHRCFKDGTLWCLFCDRLNNRTFSQNIQISAIESLASDLLGNNGLQEILDLWKYDDESGEPEVISIETGPRQKMLPQNRQVASRITAPVVFLPILQDKPKHPAVIQASSSTLVKNELKQTPTSAQQNQCNKTVNKIEPFSKPVLVRKTSSSDKNSSRISFVIENEFAALPKEESDADRSAIESAQVSNESYDDSYICTDCKPYKFLRNSESLFEHCQHMIDHGNINPICFYNKFSLKIEKICKKDSSKFNVSVRNTMAVNQKSEDWNSQNNHFEVPKKKIKTELV